MVCHGIYGMAWHGMVCNGMVWYGKVRYGMVSHSMVVNTAKNGTDMSEVFNFTDMLQLVRLEQTCHVHQVVRGLLKSGLLQLIIRRLVTTC